MKTLLVIFALCINYVLCEKFPVKSFPKKVRPYGNGKILINSAKYDFKSRHNRPDPRPFKGPKTYTVFQVVGIPKTVQGVPESPYFPIDQGYDHKTRVKKVLPDYAWTSHRIKRSAAVNETDKKDDKVKTAAQAKTAPNLSKGNPKSEVTTTKEDVTKTATKIAVSANKEADKKVEPKIVKLIGGNKNPQQRSDAKLDVETIKTKPTTQSGSKGKAKRQTDQNAKPKAKSKHPAAARAKAKGKKKTTVADVGAKKESATNVKAKKNATITRAKTGGSRKKAKKRTGKAAPKRNDKAAPKKDQKPAPQRAKSRRGAKNATKKKPANETRAGKTEKKPKAERRLISAREALIEDYPYVVSIQKDDQHWCSGALLNPRLVITTANCLWKANRVSRMEVRAGSRHIDRDGQVAGIQEVMKHPNWGLRKNPDNDVALILLDRNIRFSHDVHGVDIPNKVMMPAFDDAWVTSWGAERRDGVYDTDSTSLQVYHTRLMDREKCNNITMRFSVIVSENFICLSQSGKAAPCTRDTGAPAVSDGILWGLASWGIRKLCGTERFPAMFSYLASHSNLDFITNATHFLMSDQRHYPYGDRYPSGLPQAPKVGRSKKKSQS
ncbi:uncharacterized protein LOC110379939 [Helicoverpa armigera]